MAKESKKQIELLTIELGEDTIGSIKEKNAKINDIISAFGQIYLRKKELHEELEKLETTLEQAEADFKESNDALREELSALDKEYPRGQINLQEGTLTYNPAIKEQMNEQNANLASDNIEVVK
jgi:DNA polymerase III delta prime subunit